MVPWVGLAISLFLGSAALAQDTDASLKIKESCDEIGFNGSFSLFYSYFVSREIDAELLSTFLAEDKKNLDWKKVKVLMDSDPKPLRDPKESIGVGLGDAWELLNAPSIPIQEYALRLVIADTFGHFLEAYGKVKDADAATYFDSFDLSKVNYPDSMSARFDRALSLQRSTTETALDAKFSSIRQNSEKVCKVLGLGDCLDALMKLTEYSRPVSVPSGYLAPVALVKKVSIDSVYLKTAIHMARTVQVRLKQARAGNKVGSDFFSDMVRASEAAVADKTLAAGVAWDLVGLYGARGASFHPLDLLVLEENAPFFAAMRFVSAAINLLDSYAAKNGTAYSLPKGVTASCTFGRPYHFWYPAYLSRWLKLEGVNPKISEVAVYLAAVGYQFASPTAGHDIRLSFSTEAEGFYNNNIRFSLMFNAAGVLFGSRRTDTQDEFRLSLDPAIVATWKASDIPDPMSDEEVTEWMEKNPVSLFLRWNALIAPMTPLQVLRNNR